MKYCDACPAHIPRMSAEVVMDCAESVFHMLVVTTENCPGVITQNCPPPLISSGGGGRPTPGGGAASLSRSLTFPEPPGADSSARCTR